jgi:hypothetical protein
MKTYSLNDTIYFKLTEAGHKELNRQAEEFHLRSPECDIKYKPDSWRGDWYRQQAWWLLQHFGGSSYCGVMLPIYDLTFEEPPEEPEDRP